MKRLACAASALAVLFLAAVAGAEDAETPTIKQLMIKLHKGANAPVSVIKAALKAETTDWKAVQDASKDLVVLGAGLPRTEPKKGDRANFEKLAIAYFDDAKALDDAARRENAAQARAALTRLNASCKTCHSAHKGK